MDTVVAPFEYSVILLQMKIKTIRIIRKCITGELSGYLPHRVGGTQGGTHVPVFDPTSKIDLVFLCCFPCLFVIVSVFYVIVLYC